MSSYDKVVKLACKPKAAPPKAKYIDPIIAATWSDDGSVHDVCKALAPRFREPNVIVVFKALIVLHIMIRNGSTDNVLSYLSSSDVLRLQNVSSGNWEGYNAPETLQNYANYLNTRIRAYRDLKHDVIRVQSESNRDLRNSNAIEEDNSRGRRKSRGSGDKSDKSSSSAPTRSKTIMGKKLRVMTVEKGLLRETKSVQRMIDALVECRLYLGDLEDELVTTSLRMLVMDLLILFQAGNEGVINVLEHYFEMSHVDAKDALQIYRRFCKQTEHVVEFLGVAKKLQNLLNVPIPNLKHAPVSLAGALQEYLDDANFEQNRLEYKANKEAADKGISRPSKPVSSSSQGKDRSPAPAVPAIPAASTSKAPSRPAPNKTVADLLTSIEEEQPTIFNQQNNSPVGNPQLVAPNPFVQMGMVTGQPSTSQPFTPSAIQIQPTGYLAPQQTAFQLQYQPNPFGLQQQQAGNQPFPPSLQMQPTGFLQPVAQNGLQTGNFLQPQPTGANPFRQSMMFPQTTGMALFNTQVNPSQLQQGQSSAPGAASASSASSFFSGTSATSSAFSNSSSVISPFSQPPSTSTLNLPPRPASTPLVSNLSQQSPTQPVRTHQTGSRNPFGPSAADAPPPIPRQPTLMELAMGMGAANNSTVNQPPQQQPDPFNGLSGLGSLNSKPVSGTAGMSSVASSFLFGDRNGGSSNGIAGFALPSALNEQKTSTTSTGSMFSDSLASSLSGQSTGTTMMTTPSISMSPTLKPQATGFGGVKPFKPTSSFGAALLGSLPPIPDSPTTNSPTSSAMSPSSGFGALNAQTGGFSGSTLGVGLRPQMTGSGAANPFRASMLSPPVGNPPSIGGSRPQFMSTITSPPLGLGGGMGPTANGSLDPRLFGGAGSAFGSGFQPVTGQDAGRQVGGQSLI